MTILRNHCIVRLSKYERRWYWSVYHAYAHGSSRCIIPNGLVAEGDCRWKWQARIQARLHADRAWDRVR